MEKKFEPYLVGVEYFNVIFYMLLQSEQDEYKFGYFKEGIRQGRKMMMRDIVGWCDGQQIKWKSRFYWVGKFGVMANLWN